MNDDFPDDGPGRCDATHPTRGETCEAYAGHDVHWFGLGETWRTQPTDRKAAVEQFTAALLTGLDDLERDDHHGTLVRPGDVADLVHRVAAEVGRG